MSKAPKTVEQSLERLQLALREPDPPAEAAVWMEQIPDDLRTTDDRVLHLFAREKAAFDLTVHMMRKDIRFEYLSERDARAAVWRFVCEFHIHRSRGLVRQFVDRYARAPLARTCFFPIQLLTVGRELELHGVRLQPRPGKSGDTSEAGCIAAVRCSGTSYERMSDRARPHAEHAIRVLRATLRDHHFVPDEQLRFRLGWNMWFDDGAGGWSNPPDVGWELELDEALLHTAERAPLYELPPEGRNDVERRANVALRWFEQAQLAGDPLMEILFCFTALEAVLGDTSQGLKAPNLAIRRAMLGLLVRDGFGHPSATYALYDQVRSAAVHGEESPAIDRQIANRFAWDVRRALNEYLEFAKREKLSKRAQVRRALDEHPRRQKVIEGLLKTDPKTWEKFIVSQEPKT